MSAVSKIKAWLMKHDRHLKVLSEYDVSRIQRPITSAVVEVTPKKSSNSKIGT